MVALAAALFGATTIESGVQMGAEVANAGQ